MNHPVLQIETLALLGLMKTWAKETGKALDRKATGMAIADTFGAAMGCLERLPLTSDDVNAGARQTVTAKDAIETLFRVAKEKRDADIGNQALRLVIGFNALVTLYDLLQIETGKDLFSTKGQSFGSKQENPIDQLRRLLGGGEE